MKSNLVPILKFFKLTCIHKWYVFRAGLKTKAPLWRLVIHDWSKFLPSEAPHYARRRFGDNSDHLGYVRAWIHHTNTNGHHWEFWIPGSTSSSSPYKPGYPVPMPEWAVREMVADWLGAAMAYNGAMPMDRASWKWYNEAILDIRVHEETRDLFEQVLTDIFGSADGRKYPLCHKTTSDLQDRILVCDIPSK